MDCFCDRREIIVNNARCVLVCSLLSIVRKFTGDINFIFEVLIIDTVPLQKCSLNYFYPFVDFYGEHTANHQSIEWAIFPTLVMGH